MESHVEPSKTELLESISELFLKFGLRSTSMDDIASHLKMSKKTLYQYFANKDEVVEQVMLHRRTMKRNSSEMQKLETLDSISILFRIKQFLTNDLNARLPANHYDMRKYHPAVYQKFRETEAEETKQFFTHILTKGIKEGYFREDVDVEFQIYLFGKQLQFLREPEVTTQMEYPFARVIPAILDNFMLALATEKGRKAFEKLQQEYRNT